MKPPSKRIQVKLVGRNAHIAMIRLPGYQQGQGVVSRTIRVEDLMKHYKGPQVLLDFDKEGRLIAIEILVYDSDLPLAG